MIRRPPASMLRVSGPAIAAMARVLPTAVIRPSAMATAWASGLLRSRGVTAPLRSRRWGAAAISASRGLLGRGAFAGHLLVLLAAEHGLGVDNAEPVGATEILGEAGDRLVSSAARPIALELKQVLQ